MDGYGLSTYAALSPKRAYTFDMELTIKVPDGLMKEADTRGVSVEALVRERLRADTSESLWAGIPKKNAAEAVARMLERRKNFPLGEVTVKQLIEEGRRYP